MVWYGTTVRVPARSEEYLSIHNRSSFLGRSRIICDYLHLNLQQNCGQARSVPFRIHCRERGVKMLDAATSSRFRRNKWGKTILCDLLFAKISSESHCNRGEESKFANHISSHDTYAPCIGDYRIRMLSRTQRHMAKEMEDALRIHFQYIASYFGYV